MNDKDKTAEELRLELNRIKQENSELRRLINKYETPEQEDSSGAETDRAEPITPGRSFSMSWNNCRHFFENSSIGFFRTTPNGYFIYANPALIRMLGYNSLEELSRLDLEGESYVLHAYRRDLFKKMIEEKGVISGLETAWVRNDGRILYIRENANAFKDKKGIVLYYEGTLEDISERKQIEIELKESESRLAEVQRIARLGSWEFDPLNEKLTWSEETFRIAGLTPSLQAPSIDEYLKTIHPGDINKFRKKIRQSVGEGKELEIEIRNILPGGEIRNVYIKCRPVLKKQKVVKLLGTAVDITKHRQAEEAIRLSESRYRTLAENFPDGAVLMFNTGCCFILADGEELSKLGFPGNSIAGKALGELFPPEELNVIKPHMEGALSGRKNTFDIKRGESVYQFQTVPVRTGDNKSVTAGMIIIQDVTERRKTEESLKELNSSKDKFFSIIAHDLRSPFTSLLGLSEFMLNDLEELNREEIRNFALNIYKSSRSIFNLLENLLQWARMQIGHMEFEPVPFTINELISETLSLYQVNALRKNIELVEDFHASYMVSADKNMIQAVLRNLVSNAVKFSQHDREVTVTVKEESGYVVVSVKDRGIGIDVNLMEHLFKAGEQASRLGTDCEKGSGLGLVLCKEFIEKNGGRIWLESLPGEGSTFSFSLPVIK